MATGMRAPVKRARRTGSRQPRRWSATVTLHSNALDLEPGVFTWKEPRRIAASLMRSARRSRRRKGTAYQSAMSMLTFYINRAGRNLNVPQRKVLEGAKKELRALRSGGARAADAD